MNTPVLWSDMQHLEAVAKARHVSKAQAVRDALEFAYPRDQSPKAIADKLEQWEALRLRRDTSEAGATS